MQANKYKNTMTSPYSRDVNALWENSRCINWSCLYCVSPYSFCLFERVWLQYFFKFHYNLKVLCLMMLYFFLNEHVYKPWLNYYYLQLTFNKQNCVSSSSSLSVNIQEGYNTFYNIIRVEQNGKEQNALTD